MCDPGLLLEVSKRCNQRISHGCVLPWRLSFSSKSVLAVSRIHLLSDMGGGVHHGILLSHKEE